MESPQLLFIQSSIDLFDAPESRVGTGARGDEGEEKERTIRCTAHSFNCLGPFSSTPSQHINLRFNLSKYIARAREPLVTGDWRL
jgi:hypothetical protein